jgi:hypothetical protein
MPTQHPCDDGSHGCDTSSTQCEKGDGAGFTCACLEGFVADATPDPTQPTQEATAGATICETFTAKTCKWSASECTEGNENMECIDEECVCQSGTCADNVVNPTWEHPANCVAPSTCSSFTAGTCMSSWMGGCSANKDCIDYKCVCKSGFCADNVLNPNAEYPAECIPAPVEPDASIETSCVATASPTPEPTDAPTHMPTQHPCDDGSHGCDTSSTQCEKGDGTGFTCACLEGFVADASSKAGCVATASPTPEPTQEPTAGPTVETSIAPTLMHPQIHPLPRPLPRPLPLQLLRPPRTLAAGRIFRTILATVSRTLLLYRMVFTQRVMAKSSISIYTSRPIEARMRTTMFKGDAW